MSSARITQILDERGIDFEPTGAEMRLLRDAGAQKEVLAHVRSANRIIPPGRRTGLAAGEEAREAEQNYRRAIKENPQNPVLRLCLGETLLLQKKGDLDGAAAEIAEAVRLDPEDAVGHYLLGVTLEAKGDLDRATTECRRALQLFPDYADAHRELGRIFMLQHDLGGAIMESREVLRLEPNDAGAHADLGSALRRHSAQRWLAARWPFKST